MLILIFLAHSIGFFPSDVWWFLLVHLYQLSEFLSKAVTALTSFVLRCVGGERQVIIWASDVRGAAPSKLPYFFSSIVFDFYGEEWLLYFFPSCTRSPSLPLFTSLLPFHCFFSSLPPSLSFPFSPPSLLSLSLSYPLLG